jgi:hypothetical protein
LNQNSVALAEPFDTMYAICRSSLSFDLPSLLGVWAGSTMSTVTIAQVD